MCKEKLHIEEITFAQIIKRLSSAIFDRKLAGSDGSDSHGSSNGGCHALLEQDATQRQAIVMPAEFESLMRHFDIYTWRNLENIFLIMTEANIHTQCISAKAVTYIVTKE